MHIIQISNQNQPDQNQPDQKTQNPLKLHDPVETLGFGGSWHSNYWILRVEAKGFYVVSRLYQGNHSITQLSYPSRIHGDKLRLQEGVKLKVTGGIYSAADFLKQHGAFMLRAFDRYQ